MRQSPGFYYDIGKKARDVMYRDYGSHEPELPFKYKFLDINFDLAFQIEEFLPGLRAVARLLVPRAQRAELRYQHEYFGITAGVHMAKHPIVNLSGVVGYGFLGFGAEIAFDPASRTFTKFHGGLGFSSDFLAAALTLNAKTESLNATCHHTFNQNTRTAVAAEANYNFAENEAYLGLGAQHALLSTTLVKARVKTNGQVGALIQQQVFPKVFVSLSGEVDVKDIINTPKVGFSVALRPSANPPDGCRL